MVDVFLVHHTMRIGSNPHAMVDAKNRNGRVPASEVLIVTSAVRNLIREDKIYQIQTVLQSGGTEGMQSMDQDLLRLVQQGKIDRTDAATVAENPDMFEKGIF